MKNKLFSTKTLVLMAIFAAISVILARFCSVMLFNNTVRLGFGNIPIIYSGILLGPIAGGVVGFVSDIIGVLASPQGTFNIGINISAILYGLIPGLIVKFMGKNSSWKTIIVAHLAIYILVSLGLMTLSLAYFDWNVFLGMLPIRLITQAIIITISIFIIKLLLDKTKDLV